MGRRLRKEKKRWRKGDREGKREKGSEGDRGGRRSKKRKET